MELIENFKYLPDTLIHKIVNYTDVLIYRNGKYISRFRKNDERYIILYHKIVKPVYIGRNKILLRLINQNMLGYFIEYDFKNNLFKVNIKFLKIEIDGFDKYFDIKSNKTYIFDINNKWIKYIEYTM
jgi:hypothetical protein